MQYLFTSNSFLTNHICKIHTIASAHKVPITAPTASYLGINIAFTTKFTIAPTKTDIIYDVSFLCGKRYCVLITFA